MSVFVFWLLLLLLEVDSQPPLSVTFQGQTLPDHAFVDINDVGNSNDGSDSVQCFTGSATNRGWNFPNGATLPESNENGLYQQRLESQIDLRRNGNATVTSGMYGCEVRVGIERKVFYLGLYAAESGGGFPFTITCVSTGGPATTVTWTRDSTTVTEGTESVLVDSVVARYIHTLTASTEGTYTCTVTNSKPSNASISIKGPLLLVSHVSSQSTFLTVSISLVEGVTASIPYIISYFNINNTDCFSSSVSGITTSETEYTLSGLEEDTSYNITVTVMVTGGVTAEDNLSATTLTAVPSRSPRQMRMSVVSSTSFIVRWGSVHCRHRNGIITGYRVEYWKEGSEHRFMNVSGDFSGGAYTISGLSNATMYSVRVAAETSAGVGVYSETDTFTTPANLFLSLNVSVIPNNSRVMISDIGSTNNSALLCHTDLDPTGSHSGGDWFAPDNTRVHENNVSGFVRNRAPYVVRLLRNFNDPTPPVEGIYSCKIRDSSQTLRMLFVQLVTSEEENISLMDNITFTEDSDLNGASPQFTLTCISTGGIPSSATWTRDGDSITEGTATMLVDGVTSQYNHTLTVRGRIEGLYSCTVTDNSRQCSAQVNVQAPLPPSGVRVSQTKLGSVQVSWSPGDGLVTGYIISYQQRDGPQNGSVEAEATATSATISGLIGGSTYSIGLVATSNTLPSVVTLQDIAIGALTCAVSGLSRVIIVCENLKSTNTALQCSFNNGSLHSCFVPLVLSVNISPPGGHSVRIVTSTAGEDTVHYNVTDIKTNFPDKVPPLEVILLDGSPHVTGNSVEAEFVISRPVAGVRCFLRSPGARLYKNCLSGRVSFTNLKSGKHVLKVHAYNRRTDVATAKRAFIID